MDVIHRLNTNDKNTLIIIIIIQRYKNISGLFGPATLCH